MLAREVTSFTFLFVIEAFPDKILSILSLSVYWAGSATPFSIAVFILLRLFKRLSLSSILDIYENHHRKSFEDRKKNLDYIEENE